MKKLLTTLSLALFSFNSLATVLYTCEFDRAVSIEGVIKDRVTVVIHHDYETKKSYFFGSQGATNAIYVNNTHGVSFIEKTSSGNLMITTVQAYTLKAVHSRNVLMNGKMLHKQLYGQCTTEVS